MRVLLTTPYDLAVPGGVNRHALDLMEALTARGDEVRLAGPASAPVGTDDPRIVRLGRVWSGNFNGARSHVTLDWRVAGAVRRLVSDFAPEVVHVQEPFVPLLNALVLRQAGAARRVGTFHTYAERNRGYLWAWPWCRWIDGKLDARVAVSEAAREYAGRYHRMTLRVLPNGVRLPAAEATRRPGPPGRPARVVFVGRANEPRKGFAVLAAAMARLEAETPGAFGLATAGRGTPRGEVSDAERADLLATADVAAVPSLRGESFGLVALEALAHGVPVVASRIRGYEEWLENEPAAELVPPGDAAALAAALRRAVAEPAAHAVRCAAARTRAEAYAWPGLAERLVREVYRPEKGGRDVAGG